MATVLPKLLHDTKKYDKWVVRSRAGDKKRKWVALLLDTLDKQTTWGKLHPSLILRIVERLTAHPKKCWFVKAKKLKVSFSDGKRSMVSIKLLLYEALHGPLGPDSRRFRSCGKVVRHRARQGTDAVPPKGCSCVNPEHMEYI